jgi:sterol desaturase/sphingolipid hydroxylase (fatty acid hydroxylase superfamily)
MKLEDMIGLAIPVAFILFWGSEFLINRAGGGRRFQPVKGWFWVGIGFFLLTTVVNVSLPVWLPPDWIARHRLMDLTGLGLWGAPIAYFVVSLAAYLFHRAEHRFDVLWRGMHQMHHAVERVDMGSWAIGHPLETVVFAAYLSLIPTFVLGIDPFAAALTGTVGTIINMIPHWNVSTPRWLGYVILRPEQHCLHHERDVHARNYGGDIALWDIMFGSFQNTDGFSAPVGFERSSYSAMLPMLAFADVNGARSPRQ